MTGILLMLKQGIFHNVYGILACLMKKVCVNVQGRACVCMAKDSRDGSGIQLFVNQD